MSHSSEPGALGSVASALWAQDQGRRAIETLLASGIPVLMLKGPDLQERLYGTPGRYATGDVDVLVRRRDAAAARLALRRAGYGFEDTNGFLWRLSEAASFERAGFRLDLHWGIHAAHLPGMALRRLERALWSGSRPSAKGFLEPDPVSLLVFLAVHVVGHSFERPEWSENVRAASASIRDAAEVQRLARRCGVERSVRAALEGRSPGTSLPVLDGLLGRSVWTVTWVLRGHFLSPKIRTAIRNALADAISPPWSRDNRRMISFRGMNLVVPAGVYEPTRSTDALVSLVLDRSPKGSVVDVGCGSGAIALALANESHGREVIGIDVSTRAVRAARSNAERLGLQAQILTGSLLEPVADRAGSFDVVVSTIPFVSPAQAALTAADPRQPKAAVVGSGADGLDLVRRLIIQAADILRPTGSLIIQLSGWQWRSLEAELASVGFASPRLYPQDHGPAVLGVVERRGT